MKRPLRLAIVLPILSGLVLACSFGAEIAKESSAPDSSPLDCTPSERFFNGSCRALCTTSATCGGGTRCMEIEPGASICIDYGHCSFLDSDTQCVGTGYYNEYTRFGMETEPYASFPYGANPYDTTPYVDDEFDPNSPYSAPYLASNGCQGNAHFVKVDATGDVACGQEHEVLRCRREGHACVLASGTTKDLLSP